MHIHDLIAEIRDYTRSTFAAIDQWFEEDVVIREFKPANGGWTIHQILEHISLTNHFLLILIDKGANKALQNAQRSDLQETLATYEFHREKLNEIGLHGSFTWIRPEHMEPAGQKSLAEVRQILHDQLQACLTCLDRLPNGEGVLNKTTMSVHDLGKIDVYEYIYFLARHGQRHISQMTGNLAEYKQTHL